VVDLLTGHEPPSELAACSPRRFGARAGEGAAR
jgi:hypothetical protein